MPAFFRAGGRRSANIDTARERCTLFLRASRRVFAAGGGGGAAAGAADARAKTTCNARAQYSRIVYRLREKKLA
jgi:hypothetical protein